MTLLLVAADSGNQKQDRHTVYLIYPSLPVETRNDLNLLNIWNFCCLTGDLIVSTPF
jgi:hypothetical protein